MSLIRKVTLAIVVIVGLAGLGSPVAFADDSGCFGFYLSGNATAPS